MALEIKEKILSVLGGDKKIRILIIIAFLGILLIMLSEIVPHSSTVKKEDSSVQSDYVDSLESKTERLIGSIAGVGKCRVMITIKNSNESVYAQNSDVSSSNGNYSKKYEYVFYDGSNGDEPVLLKEYMPQVLGVAVVCEGGDNSAVAEEIIKAISSLFDISSSKISISKAG